MWLTYIEQYTRQEEASKYNSQIGRSGGDGGRDMHHQLRPFDLRRNLIGPQNNA